LNELRETDAGIDGDELREQVRNANRDQINEYMARREEWIEAQ
jgi:hypothetical protein